MNELTSMEVKYNIEFDNIQRRDSNDYIPEYSEVYKSIKTALEIDKEGYNVYLIDDFSQDKLNNIMNFIKENSSDIPPKDICYVIYDNPKEPKGLFVDNGKGHLFKSYVEEIKKTYLELTYEFYNTSDNKNKEELLDKIEKGRSELLSKMIKIAEETGFDIRFSQGGFSFIPLKDDGEVMSEKEYESLEKDKKTEIIDNVSILKKQAEKILDDIKEEEDIGIESIKKLMREYYKVNMENVRDSYGKDFNREGKVLEYLDNMCNTTEDELIENYSSTYEDDEEAIGEIVGKYMVNVLVDNNENKKPVCIYEDDPSLSNLLGTIEYENKNGVYITDVSLIKAGSMLKANGGCLIIRLSSLLANQSAYYYLKKSLISGKVDIDHNRGYLELLSLNGLHPEPIKINEKVILIGDYETYDVLYRYDDDFKKIFKLKAEFNPIVKINDKTKAALIKDIEKISYENSLKPIKAEGIKEIGKFLSRRAEDQNRFYFDGYELNKLLMLTNNKVKNQNKDFIDSNDIREILYEEETIQKEILETFKENKIYINVKDKVVGEVNGLTVLDAGYLRFGKPVRITCRCYKGDGSIIDVQKDSELSGKIHSKAINILNGYINGLLGDYGKLPVDFHLSFEQVYGKVDGDSASVAEIIAMLSSLSKIGIKGNIAVTGSVNQLGEVQPIGGVNDKIEGFFKVCNIVDTTHGKGVLIPYSNIDNLVLSKEVEDEIEKGNFHIYTMKNIEEAVDTLMGDGNISFKDVLDLAEKELKKYGKKRGF